MVRNVRKRQSELAKEWDGVVEIRSWQIESGIDLSYNGILIPNMLRAIQGKKFESVLDVGSGSGDLTNRLARHFSKVVGVDISKKSIELSCRKYIKQENLQFFNKSIQSYANSLDIPLFDLVTANMVLMTSPRLVSVIESIYSVLSPGGKFIFSITHPNFWPSYWGYEDAEWFSYDKEIFIEADFHISLSDTGHFTTHIHRPLSRYVNTLISKGFCIEKLIEPLPNKTLSSKYPTAWKFPRFLIILCEKI